MYFSSFFCQPQPLQTSINLNNTFNCSFTRVSNIKNKTFPAQMRDFNIFACIFIVFSSHKLSFFIAPALNTLYTHLTCSIPEKNETISLHDCERVEAKKRHEEHLIIEKYRIASHSIFIDIKLTKTENESAIRSKKKALNWQSE